MQENHRTHGKMTSNECNLPSQHLIDSAGICVDPVGMYHISEKLTAWNRSQTAGLSRVERIVSELSSQIESLEASHRKLTESLMAQEVSWKSPDLKSQENEMGVAAFVSVTAELQRLVAGLDDLIHEGQVERLARSVCLILEEAKESMTQLGIQPVPGVGQAYNPHGITLWSSDRDCLSMRESWLKLYVRLSQTGGDSAIVKALVAIGVCSSKEVRYGKLCWY